MTYELPKGLKRRELDAMPSDMFVNTDMATSKPLPVTGYTNGVPSNAISLADAEATVMPQPKITVPVFNEPAAKGEYGYHPVSDPEVDAFYKRWGKKYDAMMVHDKLIRKKAEHYGVDPNLVRAMIMQESSGDINATSHVGAKGLMQLMPATAKELGVTNSSDPEQNVDGGVRYILQQLNEVDRRFKPKTEEEREKLALAAYNAGMGSVRKHKGVPPFKETKGYVKNIPYFKSMIERKIGSPVQKAEKAKQYVPEVAKLGSKVKKRDITSPVKMELAEIETPGFGEQLLAKLFM